jgi:hypothetical protein
MSKKIIIAGNPNYGLAKNLQKKYPNATFYSRSHGNLNLSKEEDRNIFGKESLKYEVCILCSYIPYFKQTLLVGRIWKEWTENKKPGNIIVLGSTADTSKGARFYCIEKRALKDFCRNYGDGASGGGPNLVPGNGVKITYIAPGVLDLPKQQEKYPIELGKLDPDYLAGVIDWVINQPDNVVIHDLSIDPVTQQII